MWCNVYVWGGKGGGEDPGNKNWTTDSSTLYNTHTSKCNFGESNCMIL